MKNRAGKSACATGPWGQISFSKSPLLDQCNSNKQSNKCKVPRKRDNVHIHIYIYMYLADKYRQCCCDTVTLLQMCYNHHDGTPKRQIFCWPCCAAPGLLARKSVFYAAFPTCVCLMLNPERFPKYGKYLHIYLFMTSGQVCGMWQRRHMEDNSGLAKECSSSTHLLQCHRSTVSHLCSSSYSSKVLHNIIYVIYAPSLEAFKHSNIQNTSNVR